MRILGVDPGEKRIGIAISDPVGRVARPLQILARQSYESDAAHILQIASEQGAGIILIGQSMDEEGQPSYMGRQSTRLAETIKNKSEIPVLLWDEAFSTSEARQTRLEMGLRRSQRRSHLDDAAAAVILQSYLDSISDSAA